MTKDMNIKNQITRLEQVLDTYGCDQARWPAVERNALATLVGQEPKAQTLYREAQALERVMNAAPARKASDELKSRIVAAAVNGSAREPKVVPISASRARAGSSMHVRRSVTVMWPAAALAASFALGVYLGITGVAERALPTSLQTAALNGSVLDGDVVPWLEDGIIPDSEDLL